MKVAVYAVESKATWRIWISLDIRVDFPYWRVDGQTGGQKGLITSQQLVMLSPALPLGWAVKLRDHFQSDQQMYTWGIKEWSKYMITILQSELKEEEDEADRVYREHRVESAGEIGNENDRQLMYGVSSWHFIKGDWRLVDYSGEEAGEPSGHSNAEHIFCPMKKVVNIHQLSAGAVQLVQAVSGRSLLEPELEALLGEQLPQLSGHWRSVAQWAHLQGRLMLEAAVVDEGAVARPQDAGMARKARPAAARLPGRRQLPAAAGVMRAAALWLPHLVLRRGFAPRRALPRCRRCGSAATARTPCAACGLLGCAYCEACLALGRSRACALLLRSAALPAVRCTAGSDPTVAARRWGLSAAQAGAAGAALAFLAEQRKRSAVPGPERFLLWAVTGAGKTEITFPLLEAVLGAGGRALIATPRRDVVLELAPRLAKAFPAESLAVLYGGSAERWVGARITLATSLYPLLDIWIHWT